MGVQGEASENFWIISILDAHMYHFWLLIYIIFLIPWDFIFMRIFCNGKYSGKNLEKISSLAEKFLTSFQQFFDFFVNFKQL